MLYCIQELTEAIDLSDQVQALKEDNQQLEQLCVQLEKIIQMEQELTHSNQGQLIKELHQKQNETDNCRNKAKTLEKLNNSMRKDSKHAIDVKLLYKNCKKQYNNLLQQIQLQKATRKRNSVPRHKTSHALAPDSLDAQVQQELLRLGHPGFLTMCEPNIYTLHNRKIYVESRNNQIFCRLNGEFIPLDHCIS